MIKRRPSKRFVLAESGEEGAWDSTTDSEGHVNQEVVPADMPLQIPRLELINKATFKLTQSGMK